MSLAWYLLAVATCIGSSMESLLLLKKTAESLAEEIHDICKRSSKSRQPMTKYQREKLRKLQFIARTLNGEIGKLEALAEDKEA